MVTTVSCQVTGTSIALRRTNFFGWDEYCRTKPLPATVEGGSRLMAMRELTAFDVVAGFMYNVTHYRTPQYAMDYADALYFLLMIFMLKQCSTTSIFMGHYRLSSCLS